MWNILNNSNTKTGLTDNQVLESIKKYGDNKISSTKKEGFFRLFIETLGDPIIKILLIALAIKTIFLFKDFDWFETIGIVIAIFVASFISTISEYGSEAAFRRLQEESSKVLVKVLREGKTHEIPIEEVVVEDIIILQSGDKIPADGYLLKGNLSVDESSLNGETKEAKKSIFNLFGKKEEVDTILKVAVHKKECPIEKLGEYANRYVIEIVRSGSSLWETIYSYEFGKYKMYGNLIDVDSVSVYKRLADDEIFKIISLLSREDEYDVLKSYLKTKIKEPHGDILPKKTDEKPQIENIKFL